MEAIEYEIDEDLSRKRLASGHSTKEMGAPDAWELPSASDARPIEARYSDPPASHDRTSMQESLNQLLARAHPTIQGEAYRNIPTRGRLGILDCQLPTV